MSILLHFDGACKGNPGIGGSAAVLYKDNEIIDLCYYYHGKPVTNNIAEYMGLIGGLNMCLSNGYTNIMVEGDSKLVIEQVFGTWKCNHKNMIPLNNEIECLKKKFTSIFGRWIPREENTEADYYSNLTIKLKLNKCLPEWFELKHNKAKPKQKSILEQFGIS